MKMLKFNGMFLLGVLLFLALSSFLWDRKKKYQQTNETMEKVIVWPNTILVVISGMLYLYLGFTNQLSKIFFFLVFIGYFVYSLINFYFFIGKWSRHIWDYIIVLFNALPPIGLFLVALNT